MRLFLYTSLLFLIAATGFSQKYGNEWINYNQQYYKIKIDKEGIYRISYATLQNIGFPVGTLNPKNIQLFNNGVEQHLYIEGENDGVFNFQDFIEFYATKNDGSFDTQLYKSINNQANPNHSLFTDTAAYYLTWNTLTNNRRLTVENDVAFSSYTPITYFFRNSRTDYTSTYFQGQTNYYQVTNPDYTAGEGWFDNAFSLGQSINKSISTSNAFIGGPSAKVNYVVVSASNYDQLSPDHHLRVTFAGFTKDSTYEGYGIHRFSQIIPTSNLGGSTTSFSFSSVNDLGSLASRNTVAYIEITYPHLPSLGNATSFKFILPDAIQSKSRIDITNFNSLSTEARLYDLTNKKRIKVVLFSGIQQMLVPNSGGEKECYLTSESQITNVTSLLPVSSDPLNPFKFKLFNTSSLISSNLIFITHNSLKIAVDDYAAYRQTTIGGSYKPIVVDIEDLYEQFAFGISKNPLAIRNFLRYINITYTDTIRGLFLVGKSYTAEFYRNNPTYWSGTLVPTIGNPPSDIMLTAGILDSLFTPLFPTGRLSAKTPNHVYLFLNKVQQYDHAKKTPEEWMKRVLHFGGGSSAAEQKEIRTYLASYAKIIEDTLFGGSVDSLFKNSSAPIQTNQSDIIKNLINNGVTLMTFFGHAAGIGFDVSIDNPSEYQNTGKYPFLLANSCFAGDIFGTSNSSSDEFVLIDNKGVIGYLASITKAIAPILNIYSKEFYKGISTTNYGKPIGKVIQDVIKNIQVDNSFIKEACYEITLHGDPMVILNSQEKPDYKITPTSIFYSPSTVTTEIDSFTVNVVVKNIGKAINFPFFIELERTLPDKSTQKYLSQLNGNRFSDTVQFKVPVLSLKGIGLNTFKANADAMNSIVEISELNNTAISDLFIKSADILPVYPPKYAIVPGPSVTLSASTSYPFSKAKKYIFELDTTSSFNSPLKKIFETTQSGGIVSWTPTVTLLDSMVYFWRVSVDSIVTGNYNWRESSFQYIIGKRGWSQANFDQFLNNKYLYLGAKKSYRTFEFVDVITQVKIQTGVYPNIPWTECWYRLDNNIMKNWTCLNQWPDFVGINFAVIDPITALPWLSTNQGGGIGNYNNVNCNSYPSASFDFYTQSTIGWTNTIQQTQAWWFDQIRKFIDTIPYGHYVLAYSVQNLNALTFSEPLFKAFESIGSSIIRSVPNYRGYAIFGRKGNTIGASNEVVGINSNAVIQLVDSINSKWNNGTIESELIGPSAKWTSLHWQVKGLESTKDTVSLSVIGVKHDGTQDVLIADLGLDSLNVYNLNNRINSSIYPFVKLKLSLSDDSLHTPAQLQKWQMIYVPVPETALNPSNHYSFFKDTIREGDEARFSVAIQNISEYDMDSLLIKYWIVDNQHQIIPLLTKRREPHPKGSIMIDSINFSTAGLAGNTSLWIEVNPNNDQVELLHINNIGDVNFFVKKDATNPILDVTFDGRHILNGDIISPKTMINIILNDENPFLIMDKMDDTASFNVFIQYPNHPVPQRIYFYENGKEIMRFIPASTSNKTCKIEYQLELLLDGTYQLLVQAKDKSSNKSGNVDYKIDFEIVTKSTITEVLNWPNPFSTFTHFVFTLTGTDIPSHFKIQIMTISGKIVRELTYSDLGSIHIGRNITKGGWDGKDEFGDQLANGVYLYRILTANYGNAIEKTQTEASKYFVKEFGKMYLMR